MKVKFFLFIILIFFISQNLFPEGSYELNKNNKYRIFFIIKQKESEEFEEFSGIFFYAKKGEMVLIGSSLDDGSDNYDIMITGPDKKNTKLDIDQNGQGLIDTAKKEAAGPYIEKEGYKPLIFEAYADGIYKVDFNANINKETKFSLLKTNDKFPLGTIIRRGGNSDYQYCAISAWDITVMNKAGNKTNGRVFLYNLQCYTENGNIDKLRIYMLSKDGFIYQIENEDFKPFRFDFYCVNRGLIDSEGDTLYRSVDYQNNNLIKADIKKQQPLSHDTNTDVTHYLFLNMPADDLPDNMPIKAIPPPVPSDFKFTGIIDNKTVEGNGGIFKFNSPEASTYKLIIDNSGPDAKPDGKFDQYDISFENICVKGENKFYWDGKDKNGVYLKAFTSGTTYNAILFLKQAEFHFPLIDVENLDKGIKIKLLNPPYIPENWNTDIIYYNDEDFVSNNVKFNLSAKKLYAGDAAEITKPANPRSALNGIDSLKGAHAYTNNYGDNKIIDTWTYFPSKKITASFVVVQKKDEQIIQDERKKENLDNLKKAKEGDVISFNDIMFYPDLSKIKEESYKTLDEITAVLSNRTDILIEISGYTNSVGNPEGELKLSIERANSVMNYFISKGINPRHMKPKGYGALNLKESRVSDANRRVEIKVIGTVK